MVSLDDLKELVLYKKPFFLPIDPKNKKQGSAIMLLTPNYKSSMFAMTAPYAVNRRYFESYYFERSITRYIKNESVYETDDPGEYLFEEALSSKDRKALPDSDFGLPSQRRYPIPDKAHVLSAIRFFNYVEKEYEAELAKNIIKKIKAFDMADEVHVGKNNRFLPYWEKSGLAKNLKESVVKEEIYETLDDDYLNEIVVTKGIDILNKKLSSASNIVFSGYKRDIDAVSKYITKEYGVSPFEALDIDSPKKIIVIIISDPNAEEEITYDTLTLYTPDAFKKKGYDFDYKIYTQFIFQLYAIYRIKVVVGTRVLDIFAEPLAILLSGAADGKLDDPKYEDKFYSEKVFAYIIEEYGMAEVKKILIGNSLGLFYKYAKEYSAKYRKNARKALGESDFGIEQDCYDYIEEANKLASLSEEELAIPESIKKIQNMTSNLKRRIRRQSVYKLNKIKRDLIRGNLGTEERSTGLSTIQQLQTGNITGESKPENVEEGTFEKFKTWSKGDYILEGNLMYLFEDNINYDMLLRRALYKDRLRNVKQAMAIYKNVKATMPFIKYTYPDIYRYNKKNLFYDLSYYNETFFKNFDEVNIDDKTNSLRKFKIYAELMNRLISSNELTTYTKKTIFIPILDWRHNNSTKMWMYKEDVNPISVIYYYMKFDQMSLKRLFANYNVVFLGAKNYFKVNFSSTDFSKPKNITKFMMLIRRIITLGYNSPADPDPEGEFEDSPTGIAMDIVDKIERSQNVSIDNVSRLTGLNKSIELFDDKPNNISSSLDPDSNLKQAIKKEIVKDEKDTNLTKVSMTGKTEVKDRTKSTRGRKASVPVEVEKFTVTQTQATSDTKSSSEDKAVNTTSEDEKKDAILDKIANVANNAKSVDDALDKLNDEEFKALIVSLQTDSEENVRVDKARASKIIQIEDEFHKKEVAGRSVKEMLEHDPAETKLQSTNLKVASINTDWNNMTFMNFDKTYDPDADIIKMLDSMQHWTFPIAVKNISIKDNSTSEDYVDLWTIECIDFKGTKFTLKVDIPKFIKGSNLLKLRGNEKNVFIQSVLIPIIKTNLDECQIIGVGGYNKIFVRRFGGRKGQSMPAANKLIRTLNKLIRNNSTQINITLGDNTNVCAKYELPIDYIDVASVIDSIETNKYKFYFNQDIFRTEYVIDNSKGIPIGIEKKYDAKTKKATEYIIYYSGSIKSIHPNVIGYMNELLCGESEDFRKIYSSLPSAGSRYTYSQASILNTKIPVIILCGYLEGLISTLKKAGVAYQFVQELDRGYRYSDRHDYIKFKDGYLLYEVNYSSSLLMNGFKECDTESYSIKEVNSRRMYLEFLENYGGNLKADGIENSYDCMLDPISKEILALYKLPTDYVSVVLHANNLLSDNKYVRHTDQAGRRWRRKELIAGYFYKALTNSYLEYANSLRRNRKSVKISMKQSAIIDLIISVDPGTTNYSTNNVINDVECTNTVTNKGLVGMNQARAYSVNTRTYDESMLNVLGMDTPFSGNVGINRQATIDANIESERGLVKTIDGDASKLSVAKTLTITEGLTPLGSTHDDPQRTLMTYAQTSKHLVRCLNNDPMLVTTGADEALPYLTSNIFSYKAAQDGTVIELVEHGEFRDNYMVVQYKDGTTEYINLKEEIKKNSDGGYFVPVKLSTDLKLGDKFKAGSILAYDKLSFSKSLGESGNLAGAIGTLAKVAIINTDEGFEDSAAVTETFASKMATEVIMPIEKVVDKGSNIIVYKTLGDRVMEGDTLFAYQADFDDEVYTTLLKNLSMNGEGISELGRNPVKTKYTGIVTGIEVYRTVELEELSESLRNFVEGYERNIRRTKKIYNKYNLDTSTLPIIGKMDNIGKAKNVYDGVKIIYYIKYIDKLGVGDKIVYYSANKGIVKYIISKEDEPYTDFRPNEHVESFMSLSSISGRMTFSIPLFAATSKLMVELDRSIKDIAGIPYDDSKV